MERAFFGRVLGAMGVRLAVSGTPIRRPGTLFVANHVSWTDIPALAAVLEVRFVAKAEVRGWPVVGALADRYGTLFLSREARLTARHQIGVVNAALRAGDSVLLFPEGTTSNGGAVLPFRSTLLEAASGAAQIQPIAITYAGSPNRGWTGDESLFANIRRLAPYCTDLTLAFLQPFTSVGDRKRDAAQLRQIISQAIIRRYS